MPRAHDNALKFASPQVQILHQQKTHRDINRDHNRRVMMIPGSSKLLAQVVEDPGTGESFLFGAEQSQENLTSILESYVVSCSSNVSMFGRC